MGKAALIIVLGTVILYTVFNTNINRTMNFGYEVTVDRFTEVQARHTAYSMINILLSRMADDKGYRVTQPITDDLFNGTVTYRVIDTAFITTDTLKLVKFVAKSNYYDGTYTITTFARMAGWVPPIVRAAWTANADLNNTISDMYIDGRDYDLNFNIKPREGLPAVSSSTFFTNVDDAKIGGTHDSVDYPMTFPHDERVIEQNYNWAGGFPQSPDAILGYPDGILKAIAQTGINGSQYLYNPGKVKIGKKWFIDGLTYPVSGVTYIEIVSADEVEFQFEQNDNKGIFIIHNKNLLSRITGVKFDEATSDGLFTGLFITDYSFHHHLDILGAVIQLSPNLEDDKNCNGNEDHFVYFSSDAVINATEIVAIESGLAGNIEFSNYFGSAGLIGTGRQKIVHWWE